MLFSFDIIVSIDLYGEIGFILFPSGSNSFIFVAGDIYLSLLEDIPGDFRKAAAKEETVTVELADDVIIVEEARSL